MSIFAYFFIATFRKCTYNTVMIRNDFVERIDALLAAQHKTKIDLITTVGIPKQSIYDWRNRGTIPAADIALKIAQFLNTSVEYLLTGNETNPLSAENANLKKRLDEIQELTKY